ncbi:hypothetical protein [Actinocatenispora sera]|uniref:hypothetical protein n=1 Tax=Actinocatenispora sera TaxID=390989 RepID=UPI0012ECE993|nr:hypothetical protein [Actinocatenispora sera]
MASTPQHDAHRHPDVGRRAGTPGTAAPPGRAAPTDTEPRPGGRASRVVATRLAPAGAAAIALVLAVLGTGWLVRGDRNPLDQPTERFGTALTDFPPGAANAVFLGSCLAVCAAAVWLAASPPALRGQRRPVTVAVAAVGIAAVLTVLDTSILTVLGYLPATLIGTMLRSELNVTLLASVPLLLQVALAGAGVGLAIGLAARIRGRGGAPARVRASCRRWTHLAMEAPLVYALTRVLMFFRVPGFDLAPFGSPILWAGLGLAVSASLGALLTWGLIRPWGEVFPRWMPGLRGRRVPVLLAVLPGLLVAGLVATTSKSVVLSLATNPDALANLREWPRGGRGRRRARTPVPD